MLSYDVVNTPTRFAEINNHRLAFRTVGKGMPLILCAPFGMSLEAWDPAFIDALAAHFQVIIFDYADTGRSTGTRGLTVRAMAQDAIELADSLFIDIFALAGWSLGGLAAQAILQRFPDRITHLVLLATLPITAAASRPNLRSIGQMLIYGPGGLADHYFDSSAAPGRAAADASAARLALWRSGGGPMPDPLLRIPGGTRTGFVQEFLASIDGPRSLASTGVPILAICGENDPLCPPRNWTRLHGQWPALHLSLTPQAGHAPHHQSCQFFAELVINFVTNIG